MSPPQLAPPAMPDSRAADSPATGKPRSAITLARVGERLGNRLWLVPPLAFIAIAIALYPVAISIKDESVYLATAYILRAGTVFADVAHVSVISPVQHGGHVAPLYPPGVGALLLPAVLISWHAVFAVNLLLQVAGFFIFRDLLGRLGISRGWAILYLFYPTLVLYSRTVMSEVPSATMLLLALDLYARTNRSWRIGAGAVLGLLGFFRFANPIPATLLIAGALVADIAEQGLGDVVRSPLRRSTRALPLLLGFVPVTLLFVGFNLHVYGAPFGPYGSAGSFGPRYIPNHLLVYAADLTLIWPLMVLAPLFYRGRLWREATMSTYGTLLVMASWYYVDDVHGSAENVVTTPRLLLPVIPIWLLTYAGVLDRLLATPARRTAALLMAGTVGITATIGISLFHQRHLRQVESVRHYVEAHVAPGTRLVINAETGVVVGPAWGTPRFTSIGSADVPALRCPGAPPVTVVYTGKGDASDAASLRMSQAAAHSLGAQPLRGSAAGTWTVSLWERGSCPS